MHNKILIPALMLCLFVGLGAVACGNETGTSEATATSGGVTTVATAPATSTTTTLALAELEPIVVPTLPEEIPGYTEVDPATGLHVTGEPVVVDLATYRLKVGGKVAQELSLSYDDLRQLPKVTSNSLLNCPGFFTDQAGWSGASLMAILETAGVQPDAERIIMKSADGYSAPLLLEDALVPGTLLAYELMGEPLPVLHGFPLRAVIPGKDGNIWVKWLAEIVVQ